MTFLFFILLFHLENEDNIIKTKKSIKLLCMYVYIHAFLYEKTQEKQSNVDHVNVILLSFLPS